MVHILKSVIAMSLKLYMSICLYLIRSKKNSRQQISKVLHCNDRFGSLPTSSCIFYTVRHTLVLKVNCTKCVKAL